MFKAIFDDFQLDILDGDGVIVDAQNARPFTRRGAQTAREFREVVGRVETVEGLTPPAQTDQIVPLRDDVPQRATVVAEGDPAIHAPGRLLAQIRQVLLFVHLVPVQQPKRNRPVGFVVAGILLKSMWVSHQCTASIIASAVAASSRP